MKIAFYGVFDQCLQHQLGDEVIQKILVDVYSTGKGIAVSLVLQLYVQLYVVDLLGDFS